jgi:hypothetical protein
MKASKTQSKNCSTAPYPTLAQSDYYQNGLVLPKTKKNLELLLWDVQHKGFLDIEFCYHLRSKEAVGDVKNAIAVRLNQKKDKGVQKEKWNFVECVEECLLEEFN